MLLGTALSTIRELLANQAERRREGLVAARLFHADLFALMRYFEAHAAHVGEAGRPNLGLSVPLIARRLEPSWQASRGPLARVLEPGAWLNVVADYSELTARGYGGDNAPIVSDLDESLSWDEFVRLVLVAIEELVEYMEQSETSGLERLTRRRG